MAHALAIAEFTVAQELSCRARRSTHVTYPDDDPRSALDDLAAGPPSQFPIAYPIHQNSMPGTLGRR